MPNLYTLNFPVLTLSLKERLLVTEALDSIKEFTERAHKRIGDGTFYIDVARQARSIITEELHELRDATTKDEVVDALCDLFVVSSQMTKEDPFVYCIFDLSFDYKVKKKDNIQELVKFLEKEHPEKLFSDILYIIFSGIVEPDVGYVLKYLKEVVDNNLTKFVESKPTDEDLQTVIDKYTKKGSVDIVCLQTSTKDGTPLWVYKDNGGNGKVLKPPKFRDLLRG